FPWESRRQGESRPTSRSCGFECGDAWVPLSSRSWAASIVTRMRGVSTLAILAMISLAACHSSEPANPGPSPIEDPPAAVPEGSRLDTSASVAFWDRQRSGVWVANGDAGSISFFDPAGSRVLYEIVTGGNLTSIAVAPDGRWLAAVDRENAALLLI